MLNLYQLLYLFKFIIPLPFFNNETINFGNVLNHKIPIFISLSVIPNIIPDLALNESIFIPFSSNTSLIRSYRVFFFVNNGTIKFVVYNKKIVINIIKMYILIIIIIYPPIYSKF